MFSHYWCYIERGCYQAIQWYRICRSRFSFVVAASSHDHTFVDAVWSINIRYEPGYEPVRASRFRDYSTGLTIANVQELTQWLVDRPLSVTVSKLNNFLKFLKCRRNMIWNICHPKNDLVAPENNMLPVIFCVSTRTQCRPWPSFCICPHS